jgi:hypothetical protein
MRDISTVTLLAAMIERNKSAFDVSAEGFVILERDEN